MKTAPTLNAAELQAIATRAARRLTLDVRAVAVDAQERTIGWRAFEAAAVARIAEALAESLRLVAAHARQAEKEERAHGI